MQQLDVAPRMTVLQVGLGIAAVGGLLTVPGWGQMLLPAVLCCDQHSGFSFVLHNAQSTVAHMFAAAFNLLSPQHQIIRLHTHPLWLQQPG